MERVRVFRQHKERLLTLRNVKMEKYKNSDVTSFLAEDQVYLRDDIDLFSDAGSQATSGSRSTRYLFIIFYTNTFPLH